MYELDLFRSLKVYENLEVWGFGIYFNRDIRKDELVMVFKFLGGRIFFK